MRRLFSRMVPLIALAVVACGPVVRPGGNVGDLSAAEQTAIARDLFSVFTRHYPLGTLVQIEPTSAGEEILEQLLREAGYAVQGGGDENQLRLDFYYLETSGVYVGVLNAGERRYIRRYQYSNGKAILLGGSLASPSGGTDG